MPKFDRAILAKFLPPRYITAFEQLNTNVDETIPALVDEANAAASQAVISAQQALRRLDDLEARQDADDIAPPRAFIPAKDSLAPGGSFDI